MQCFSVVFFVTDIVNMHDSRQNIHCCIKPNQLLENCTFDFNNPVEIALGKFENHQSTTNIREIVDDKLLFDLCWLTIHFDNNRSTHYFGYFLVSSPSCWFNHLLRFLVSLVFDAWGHFSCRLSSISVFHWCIKVRTTRTLFNNVADHRLFCSCFSRRAIFSHFPSFPLFDISVCLLLFARSVLLLSCLLSTKFGFKLSCTSTSYSHQVTGFSC